jgi:hypothetical protein
LLGSFSRVVGKAVDFCKPPQGSEESLRLRAGKNWRGLQEICFSVAEQSHGL